MDVSLYVGMVGMVLVLIAFILEIFFKVIHREHIVYVMLNFIGSGAMMFYAYSIAALPFLVLNTIWFIFSIYGLFLDISKRYNSKHRI